MFYERYEAEPRYDYRTAELHRAEEKLDKISQNYSKKRAVVRGVEYGLALGISIHISPELFIPLFVCLFYAAEAPGLEKAKKDWNEAKKIVAEYTTPTK